VGVSRLVGLQGSPADRVFLRLSAVATPDNRQDSLTSTPARELTAARRGPQRLVSLQGSPADRGSLRLSAVATPDNRQDSLTSTPAREQTDRGASVKPRVKRAGGAMDPERYGEPRRPASGGTDMALFMDTHTIEGGVSAADVEAAHAADLATQAPRGVSYQRYWVDEAAGKIFCLVEAPDAEAAARVHRDAHGLVADEIYAVTEGS
jgi:hypothetical protein